jgi:uncharacterized protein with HEPN domain
MPRDPRAKPIEDRDRLRHMLEAATDAVSFIQGRTRPDLDHDRMLLHALVHCVQVIGEAAARTSELQRQQFPNLPWPKMVGMRHILVHAYFEVDADAVWRVVAENLPELIRQLQLALTPSAGPDEEAPSP